jgi:PAS domain-containing protein
MYPELAYSAPFFISAISIFATGLFICFQPLHPLGFWYLVILCFSAAFWSLTEGMLYLGFPADTNMRITYIQHLGTVPLTPSALLFVLSFFRFDTPRTRELPLVLATIAIGILALVWTDPLHHLVYQGHYTIYTDPVPMLGLHHSPAWWLIMGYHYLLTLTIGVALFRVFVTTTGPLRLHAALVLTLLFVVWGCNAIYVTGNSPLPNMDMGPLTFILVAGVMAWGFYRFNFLDIHPIGRNTFFNAIENPILVLDTRKRLLDLNPAAEKVFNLRGGSSVGKHISDLLPGQPLLAEDPELAIIDEFPILCDGATRFFERHVSSLQNNKALDLGFIYTFHDVTERKKSENAMRESQRLQGVLDIAHAVCQDMQPPLDVILQCSEQIMEGLPADHPEYDRSVNLDSQIRRLEKTAHKLMGITRYKTRGYLTGRIIDIDMASTAEET